MDPRLPEPPGSPRLLRARGVGEILVDAFEVYRRHWQNLIAIVAVVVVPLTILQVVLVDAFIDDVQVQELPDGTVQVTGDVGSAVAGGIVVALVSTLAFLVLTVAETYRYGFARLGSILLVAVLVVLAVIGGFILLIIPGFIVLTRLWVSMPAVVIEDRRGREALKRSWNLVTGYGWPVFGAIIVSGLLTGLLSSLLTAVFPDNLAGQAIGQTIATILTTPYSALVGILIYFSLRVRKEGYGIEDLERDLARTEVT